MSPLYATNYALANQLPAGWYPYLLCFGADMGTVQQRFHFGDDHTFHVGVHLNCKENKGLEIVPFVFTEDCALSDATNAEHLCIVEETGNPLMY